MKNAIAHIGGTSKEDILQVPDVVMMEQQRAAQPKGSMLGVDLDADFQNPNSAAAPAVKMCAESAATLDAIQSGS